MIILITISWYLIGSIGGLWILRKIYPKTTNGDLVFLFTIGGISGLLTVFIGLIYLLPNEILTYKPRGRWWNKQVF